MGEGIDVLNSGPIGRPGHTARAQHFERINTYCNLAHWISKDAIVERRLRVVRVVSRRQELSFYSVKFELWVRVDAER